MSASLVLNRIASITYKVEQRGKVQFLADDDVHRDVTLDAFTGSVKPHSAVFKPTDFLCSLDEARRKLDPQLTSWRAWVMLTEQDDLLVFTFQSATYEMPPLPHGHHGLSADSAIIAATGQIVAMSITRKDIPAPPLAFQSDGLVEVGLALYADALSIPRHALKFCYAFLTLIEAHYGGQQRTADSLRVSNVSLKEFKDFSSRGGDGPVARKAATLPRMVMTVERTDWLMRIFRELIIRHGKLKANCPCTKYFEEFCPGPNDDFPYRAKQVES